MIDLDIDLVPGVGMGPLKFGMTLSEAREILGVPTRTSSSGARGTDRYYADSRLMVHFLEKGGIKICFGFEVSYPAKPRLFGQEVIRMSYEDAFALLQQFDPNTVDDDGIAAEQYGVHINLFESDNTVQSVFIYSPILA